MPDARCSDISEECSINFNNNDVCIRGQWADAEFVALVPRMYYISLRGDYISKCVVATEMGQRCCSINRVKRWARIGRQRVYWIYTHDFHSVDTMKKVFPVSRYSRHRHRPERITQFYVCCTAKRAFDPQHTCARARTRVHSNEKSIRLPAIMIIYHWKRTWNVHFASGKTPPTPLPPTISYQTHDVCMLEVAARMKNGMKINNNLLMHQLVRAHTNTHINSTSDPLQRLLRLPAAIHWAWIHRCG